MHKYIRRNIIYSAFTLLEVLVVLSVVAILTSVLIPTLSSTKRKADRISCMNNLKQCKIAIDLYSSDFNNQCPLLTRNYYDCWIFKLHNYYITTNVLKCPADRKNVWRSYLINGWNDYYKSTLNFNNYQKFENGQWFNGFNLNLVNYPSQTILFGEKRADSNHVHMDLFQGKYGNDLEEISVTRHNYGNSLLTASSNYCFVDGSVRWESLNEVVRPENKWAVTKFWRIAASNTIK